MDRLLEFKSRKLAGLGVADVDQLQRRFSQLADKSAAEVASLYDFEIIGVHSV